jgi:predicted NBD/HSP70 family sugar kinase
LENDGIAAAIGEGAYGAGQHQADFICLTFGTGIGSGVIENNQISRGPFENGIGELGHICLHPRGKPCACGRLGCFEQYGSANSLIRAAQTADNRVTDGLTLFRLEVESQLLHVIIDQWLNQVVLGLAKIQEICQTKCMILGGGIFEQPALLPRLQNVYASFAVNPAPLLKKAALGNKAGLYGAMTLAKAMCESMMSL